MQMFFCILSETVTILVKVVAHIFCFFFCFTGLAFDFYDGGKEPVSWLICVGYYNIYFKGLCRSLFALVLIFS